MNEAVSLHVERAGVGPPIVFAHGFGGSARNFRKQAKALGESHSVLAYDARGHARSAAPLEPDAYSPEALFDDFGRVLGSASPTGVAAGLSMGAYTALGYALRAKPAPRALVLASYPMPRSNPARKRWANGFADAIEERGLDAAGSEFVWGPDSRFDESSAKFIRQGFLEHSAHGLAALLRRVVAEIPDPDELATDLVTLDIPTLIVAGSEDTDALAPSERLAHYLPDATLVVLPGAGHLVNLQANDAFNEAVRDFLAHRS